MSNLPKEVREAMARAMWAYFVRNNVDAALSALGEAGYEVTRKTDVDFRYRLADLLRDLHQRKPEAIDAAGEVIAFFRAAMLSASQEQSDV